MKHVLYTKKKIRIFSHLITSCFLIIIFHFLYFSININEQNLTSNAINAIFRNDKDIGNTAFYSRRLADLETLKIIECVSLTSNLINSIYSTNFKANCNKLTFIKNIYKIKQISKIQSIDGENYQISFLSINNFSNFIYVSILLFLILLISNLSIFIYWIKSDFQFRILNEKEKLNMLQDLKIKEQSNEIVKAKLKEKYTSLAKQVAHDIRSPLSALNMVIDLLNEVPEEKLELLKNASQRINDIANDLLDKSKQSKIDQVSATQDVNFLTQSQVLKNTNLNSILESIVKEKQLQYKNYNSVHIQYINNENSEAFSYINSAELSRIISNLINNSVEALTNNTGKVTVTLTQDQLNNFILIHDNGKGISPEVISKLGHEEISIGKDKSNLNNSGSGLGVYHAKKTIDSWHGHLKIESQLNVGTTFTIILPQTLQS